MLPAAFTMPQVALVVAQATRAAKTNANTPRITRNASTGVGVPTVHVTGPFCHGMSVYIKVDTIQIYILQKVGKVCVHKKRAPGWQGLL